MEKEIIITTLPNGTKIGEYEPGNGTNYKAIAVPWNLGKSMNSLGCVVDGWLVVSCMASRKAYLFQADGPLVNRYIQEKLGGYEGDYPYFGNLIRRLIRR